MFKSVESVLLILFSYLFYQFSNFLKFYKSRIDVKNDK